MRKGGRGGTTIRRGKRLGKIYVVKSPERPFLGGLPIIVGQKPSMEKNIRKASIWWVISSGGDQAETSEKIRSLTQQYVPVYFVGVGGMRKTLGDRSKCGAELADFERGARICHRRRGRSQKRRGGKIGTGAREDGKRD